jgi:hypothetical protein
VVCWVQNHIHMTKPSESEFADRNRHWKIHQQGNLVSSFLHFPLVMYCSMSWAVIRPSLTSILPLSSQDRKNQSHIYRLKYKFKKKQREREREMIKRDLYT